MKMFGHGNISHHHKLISLTDLLQNTYEQVASASCSHQRLATVAAGSDEM